MLFPWFVGMNLDEPVWDTTVFTKNRNRLLEGNVAREFLCEVVKQAEAKVLTSDEHFTVDGTLIEAWASLKSFQRKDHETGRRTIPATLQWTSTARSGAIKLTNRPPLPARCWYAGGGKECLRNGQK